MPTTKITKRTVDGLKPGPKDQFVWDSQDKGFGVKVSKAGKITFIVQKRMSATTPSIRINIGDYGVFAVDQARQVAQEHLRSIRMGIDPRDTRRESDARAVTLRETADAYFARGLLKDATRDEMDRHIEVAFKKWKDRAITSITPAECRALFEKIASEGLGGRPAPAAAASYFTTLRTLCNFAIEEYRQVDGTPILNHNPVSILKRDMKPSRARTRHIDRRQIGQFWNWLNEARVTARNVDAAAGVDLVKFLLLTGARRMEGAALTWDRVHLNDDDPTDNWWFIPDPKNRNPVTLPLSTACVAVLKQRQRAAALAETESLFVFPSRSKSGHVRDTRAPLERFAPTIGMERLSAHDLRRTFVTLGAKACGLDVAKLELLTNHVPQGITAKHYLETSDLRDYWREVQAIADYIEGEAAKDAGANVIALPVAR